MSSFLNAPINNDICRQASQNNFRGRKHVETLEIVWKHWTIEYCENYCNVDIFSVHICDKGEWDTRLGRPSTDTGIVVTEWVWRPRTPHPQLIHRKHWINLQSRLQLHFRLRDIALRLQVLFFYLTTLFPFLFINQIFTIMVMLCIMEIHCNFFVVICNGNRYLHLYSIIYCNSLHS